jgi:hypothetical protein
MRTSPNRLSRQNHCSNGESASRAANARKLPPTSRRATVVRSATAAIRWNCTWSPAHIPASVRPFSAAVVFHSSSRRFSASRMNASSTRVACKISSIHSSR